MKICLAGQTMDGGGWMDTGVETAAFYKWSSRDDGGLDFRSGLPSWGTSDAQGQTGLCCGNSPVHCRTLSSSLATATRCRQHTVQCPLERPTGLGAEMQAESRGQALHILVEAGGLLMNWLEGEREELRKSSS